MSGCGGSSASRQAHRRGRGIQTASRPLQGRVLPDPFPFSPLPTPGSEAAVGAQHSERDPGWRGAPVEILDPGRREERRQLQLQLDRAHEDLVEIERKVRRRSAQCSWSRVLHKLLVQLLFPKRAQYRTILYWSKDATELLAWKLEVALLWKKEALDSVIGISYRISRLEDDGEEPDSE